jgi:predicted nucleotidyltransferase
MKAHLHPDFRDFLITLNKHGVKYLVVGGYAVIYHGYNRTTGDLDIWVEQSKESFGLLMNAFLEFGLPVSAISEKEFLMNKMDVYTFGVPPVCIEIITAVKGIQFEESFANASKVDFDGVQVNMIDLQDLVRNKKAVGRNKDLDDVEHLS